MAVTAGLAADVAQAALVYYVREKMLSQTTQDKPLLKKLQDKSKTFPSGNAAISVPIQGTFMADTAGFLQGYTTDEVLSFRTAANMQRASFSWYEIHAGLVISWTELKIDGISIVNNSKTSQHSGSELTRLTSILENRLEDFGESWARAMNKMLWQDGSQDSQQIPGVTALLTTNLATGSIGGISKVTYAWWRNRINTAIPVSGANSSLIQYLNSEILQLKRFGGNPDLWICGSAFLDALRIELVAKGEFTNTGYSKGADVGVGALSFLGMTFVYDPTLDDLALSKACYAIDTKRLVLRPMEGEANKIIDPERPYDQMVFLKSMTYTGGLVISQLNGSGVYGVV